MYPGAEGYKERMNKEEGVVWKELAAKLYIAKDWAEYFDMVRGVIAKDSDGLTATIGTRRYINERAK